MIPAAQKIPFQTQYQSNGKTITLLSFDNFKGIPNSGIASQCIGADHSSKCDYIEFMNKDGEQYILLIEASDFQSTLTHLQTHENSRNTLISAICQNGVPKKEAIKICKDAERELFYEIKSKSTISILSLFYLPKKFAIRHDNIMNAKKTCIFVAEGQFRTDIARILDNIRLRLRSDLNWAFDDILVMTEADFIDNMIKAGF